MAVFCDACETKLSDDVSNCCQADVWAIIRADGNIYICQNCGDECGLERLKLEELQGK